MVKNEYGFMVAAVEESKCINCNVCRNRCPLNRDEAENIFVPNYYAAISKDLLSLKKSASGGAFYVFAKKIIEKNGIVFGCVLDDAMNPIIRYTDSVKGLKKMQGSKYVEADVKDTFAEAKSFLDSKKVVLYSGTPCKISALKKYLNRDYDNLICCEIICHGVASAQLFHEYVDYLSKRLKGTIIDISFRDKKKGWGSLLKITYKKGDKTHVKYLSKEESSYYYYYYMENAAYRDACYECAFADSKRNSDITVGDFWGGRRLMPYVDSDLGMSAIIVSTGKGQSLFNECSELFEYIETDFGTMSKENPNLVHPTERKAEAALFWQEYLSGGFESVEQLHKKTHKKNILIGKTKRLLPYSVIKLIRKLRGLI